MKTEEHLEPILTFCRSRLALPIGSLNSSASRAGWRATITAVIAILSSSQTTVHWNAILKPMRDEIIAAYPPELLETELR